MGNNHLVLALAPAFKGTLSAAEVAAAYQTARAEVVEAVVLLQALGHQVNRETWHTVKDRNPTRTSTRGLGKLIQAACDGGLGMACLRRR